MKEKQITKNKNLAAHHGGGSDSQGGAQQGTGARGEQYLDGPTRSHTIAPKVLFGISSRCAPKQIGPGKRKNSLTECPFFRSKRTEPQPERVPAGRFPRRFNHTEFDQSVRTFTCFHFGPPFGRVQTVASPSPPATYNAPSVPPLNISPFIEGR